MPDAAFDQESRRFQKARTGRPLLFRISGANRNAADKVGRHGKPRFHGQGDRPAIVRDPGLSAQYPQLFFVHGLDTYAYPADRIREKSIEFPV